MPDNRPAPWRWSSDGFLLDARGSRFWQQVPGAVSDRDGRLAAAAPEMAAIHGSGVLQLRAERPREAQEGVPLFRRPGSSRPRRGTDSRRRMNFDALQRSYWDAQVARVEDLRQKIKDAPTSSGGRVVPGEDDLTIGQGRRLQLAVMFIDISGFSDRASNTEAEQETMLRVLNLFFTEMTRNS